MQVDPALVSALTTWGAGAVYTGLLALLGALLRMRMRLSELNAKYEALLARCDEQDEAALSFRRDFQGFMLRIEDKMDVRLSTTESQLANVRESLAHLQGSLHHGPH